jgi:hypothetical protein
MPYQNNCVAHHYPHNIGHVHPLCTSSSHPSPVLLVSFPLLGAHMPR